MDGADGGYFRHRFAASAAEGMFPTPQPSPPPPPPLPSSSSAASAAEGAPFLFPHSVSGSRASAAPAPVAAELVRRKRGRPRKYGASHSPSPSASAPANASLSTLSPSSFPDSSAGALPRKKEASSSKKAQLAALGNAGQGFTPHTITIAAGEDVAQKIMSFMQQNKRAVCILSASGSISNASLRQPAMSGGNVSYEGRFEILSLSGSFLQNQSGGSCSRTGGLSVCLSGADGRIVGGAVGGPLIAAAPVQVIAGSFLIDAGRDTSSALKMDNSVGTVVFSPSTLRSTPESGGRITTGRGRDDHQTFGGSGSSYVL